MNVLGAIKKLIAAGGICLTLIIGFQTLAAAPAQASTPLNNPTVLAVSSTAKALDSDIKDKLDKTVGSGTSDKLEGATQQAAGTVKRQAGKLAGQAEGTAQQVKGRAKSDIGRVKDAAEDASEAAVDQGDSLIDNVKNFFNR